MTKKKLSEEEIVKAISNVVNRLAHKFRFGYHDIDDIKQEGTVFALEALDKWDGERKLENFLYTHVKNRLGNYKRDNYSRYDKPCFNCPLKAYDPEYLESNNQCTAYTDKMECKPWASWHRINSSKQNLMEPIGIDMVNDENEKNFYYDDDVTRRVSYSELIDIINENLPPAIRADYFRMLSNVPISKHRKQKVQDAIKQILQDKDYA